MAHFPCDVADHRYVGAQQTMYPALLVATGGRRRKLRLCPEHFDAYMDQLHQHLQLVDDQNANDIIRTCALCDTDVNGQSGSFFVTVYATRSERADWYGTVHLGCLDALAEDWLLPAGMP